MRRSLVALLAVASLLPLGALATAPAGAAAHALTCKQLTGTLTWSKPLPKLGDKKKVVANVHGSGKLSSCSGTKGVTSGTFKLAVKGKTPSNCTTLATAGGAPTVANVTITWNNKKTSLAPKLSFKSIGLGIEQASGKITGGTLFKGKAVGGQALFTADGGCKTPMKKASLSVYKTNFLTFG